MHQFNVINYKFMGWNTHHSQNQRWINVIDVDSTSQQRRLHSGVLAGYVGNNGLGDMDLIYVYTL